MGFADWLVVGFGAAVVLLVVGWMLWGYFLDWRLGRRDALRAEIRAEVLENLKISMYCEGGGTMRQLLHCDAGYALNHTAFSGDQLFDQDVAINGRMVIMVKEGE